MGFGAVQLRIVAMVLGEVELMLILPTSASVPVFTDQRSTPQALRSGVAEKTPMNKARAIIPRGARARMRPPAPASAPTGSSQSCKRQQTTRDDKKMPTSESF